VSPGSLDGRTNGPIKESTKAFFQLHGWKKLGTFLHGYYYLARLDQYLKILLPAFRVLNKVVPESKTEAFRGLFAFVPDRYHGKVISVEDATKIVTANQDIVVSSENSKKVIPFELANQITIRNPDSIVVIDCGCRKEKKNHCEPVNVCMMVGEPFASFTLEHAKTLNPRRITQKEAADLLEDCHRKGLVHNAYFKDAMGDQFYAICNCCKCCCGGIELERTLRSLPLKDPVKELAPSGYIATIDEEKCVSCGVCVERCPFGTISMEEEPALVNPVGCMGCGACLASCPSEAIEMKKDPTKSAPLDLDALIPEARPQP